jgi:hypothetical protein
VYVCVHSVTVHRVLYSHSMHCGVCTFSTDTTAADGDGPSILTLDIGRHEINTTMTIKTFNGYIPTKMYVIRSVHQRQKGEITEEKLVKNGKCERL